MHLVKVCVCVSVCPYDNLTTIAYTVRIEPSSEIFMILFNFIDI